MYRVIQPLKLRQASTVFPSLQRFFNSQKPSIFITNQLVKPSPQYIPQIQSSRSFCNPAPAPQQQPQAPLNKKEQLKKAFKDYGSTVIIFHVGISLISLGSFYLLVSTGLDVVALVEKMGFSSESFGKVGANASTFVLAYAIHKVFAPVRISITLFSTPFIVRALRSRGILKPPKKF